MKNITLILVLILSNFTKNMAQFRNNGAAIWIQPGATLKIDTDFINDAGSDFRNNSKVILTKNVVNNQAMTEPTIGDWEFSGTTQQVISGNSFFKIWNAEFANPNGFELNNIVRIVNEAKFTNGLVEANDTYSLFFGPFATIPIEPTDASHVFGGAVVKEGTSPFTYPVGDMWKYQPIKADFTTNTNGLGVKYVAGNAGIGPFTTGGSENTALIGFNTNEYWDFYPIGGGTSSANITVFWDGYKDGYINEAINRRVAHKVGSNWQNEGLSQNTTGNPSSGSVKSNLINSWSPFTLGFVQATTPLPLRLISFTGKKVESGNQLNWQTSNEVGVSHFEIERSENGKSFDKIGETSANGGPAENVDYKFIDTSTSLSNQSSSLIVQNSSLFYRLKMIDLDGKYSFSKIISIKNEAGQNSNLKLYPNPAISELNIENMEGSTVEVTTLNGQSTSFNVLKKNELQSSIDVSTLPKGLYFLKAGNQISKFLKQ
jgi:Secretion system C-terminal sorting domain